MVLFDSLHALGNLREAEQHTKAFLAQRGVDPWERAQCLSGLSAVLRDQGRLSEALQRAEEATAAFITIPKAHALEPDQPFSWLSNSRSIESFDPGADGAPRGGDGQGPACA
jgi:hypothetical protein